jgi:RecA-family ATPase
MMQSQQQDPECQSIMEQMKTMSVGGNAALKTQGVSQERMRYLQLHKVDPDGLLRCADVIVNKYGGKEDTTDDDHELVLSPGRVVVPLELRAAILYLHHHSRLASHMQPGWIWWQAYRRQDTRGED